MPDLMHHTKRELCAIIEKERRETEAIHRLFDSYGNVLQEVVEGTVELEERMARQRWNTMCFFGDLLPPGGKMSDVIVFAPANAVNISSTKRQELVRILVLCQATLEAFEASPQLDQQLNGWIEVLNQPEQEREDRDTAILREAGCTCPEPLLGETPGVGPRCRLCNTQGKF